MNRTIQAMEYFIFWSRWLQAPLYLGLIVAQGVYVYQFMHELGILVTKTGSLSETEVMLIVLGLIDVVMIANLLIMVIIGGYETFVSRLDLEGHPDQPEWLSHVNAGVLKVKLAIALISISSIHLLRTFINAAASGRSRGDHPGRHPRRLPALGHRHRLDRQDHDADAVSEQSFEALTGGSSTMSASIRQDDFIQSIVDAFQFISYYHPLDYIQALGRAYEREESPAAKDAIAQILTNSRLCAEGKRPICQDTGIAVVFLKIGMHVKWDATLSVQEMVDEGVRRAYLHPDNKLRASVLLDPAGARKNIEGQHAGGDSLRDRSGRPCRGDLRGQGWRLGKQVQDGHAQSVGFDRRLGAQDRADHGRRLVPAGHPRHRHRRHARKRRCCWPRNR